MDRLKLVHININGLWGKKTMLNLFLNKYNPDIVSINEVITKRILKFEGYQDPLRFDRPLNNPGGGVILMFKKGLQYEVMVKITIDHRGNELRAANVVLHDKTKILFASLYVPPKINMNKNLVKELKKINSRCVITGDLNFHNRNLGSRNKSRPDFNGRLLQELISEERFVYKNQGQFTYLDTRTNLPECLDVILASADIQHRTKQVIKLEDIGSDHSPIMIDIASKPIRNHKTSKPRFLYEKANWEKYEIIIEQGLLTLPQIEPGEIPNKEKIDEITEGLVKVIIDAANKTIPKSKPKEKQKQSLPRYIIDKIKLRNQIRKEYQDTRAECLKQSMNRLKKNISREVDKVKEKENQRLVNEMIKTEANSPKFWKMYKNLKNSHLMEEDEIPTLFNDKYDQNPAHTNVEKANKFANLLQRTFKTQIDTSFDDNFKKEAESKVQEIRSRQNPQQRRNILVNNIKQRDLKSALKNMKNNKSPGPDQIQAEMLKHLPSDCLTIIK